MIDPFYIRQPRAIDKVIYRGVIRLREVSEEMAPSIQVTEETNGFAIWRVDPDGKINFEIFTIDRDETLELAVTITEKHRRQYREKEMQP